MAPSTDKLTGATRQIKKNQECLPSVNAFVAEALASSTTDQRRDGDKSKPDSCILDFFR